MMMIIYDDFDYDDSDEDDNDNDLDADNGDYNEDWDDDGDNDDNDDNDDDDDKEAVDGENNLGEERSLWRFMILMSAVKSLMSDNLYDHCAPLFSDE